MNEKILKLIKDSENDSKKISEESKKDLINICVEQMKKYYDVLKRYDRIEWSDVFYKYNPYENKNLNFLYEINNHLLFYFLDYETDKDVQIYFPLNWFDNEIFEKFEKFQKDAYIKSLKNKIEYAETKIEEWKKYKEKYEREYEREN